MFWLYFSILLFLILFGFLTWKKTINGLYLIVLFLPTYLIRFKILSIPFTLLEGMILLLFLIWLVKLYRAKIKINFNFLKPASNNIIPFSFRWPIILFLLSATIAVFISDNQLSAMGIWKAYFIEPLLFLIVLIYTVKNKQQIKNLIYCLGLLTIAIGFLAMVQKFTGLFIDNPFWQAEATRRVTTFFSYPNAAALLVAPIIILAIGSLLTDKKITCLILNILAIVLGSLTLFWVKSTGAILGLLAGLVFLLIYYKKTRIITSILVGLLIILTLTLTASPYNFQNIKKQLAPHRLGLVATSLEIRINQWQEVWQMLKDNPLAGAGLANYQNKIKPYHQYDFIEIYLYPHNLFLNFWSELGLLGLVSFVWLIIIFFIYAFRSLKKSVDKLLGLTIIAAMLTLLIHGLVDVPYFKNDLAILFWIIVGLLIINKNEIPRNEL